MKKYKYYNAFYMSFYSKDFYIDVARNWTSLAFGYLFIVVCICWFFNMLKFQSLFSNLVDADIAKIVKPIPGIDIIDGKININTSVPHYISLNFIKKWFIPLLYPFAVIGLFIFHICQVSLYGAIGIVFNKILKNNLDYKTLVRLSVMSLMPVFFLSNIRFVFGIHMPYLTLIGFFISMSYLYFGIKVSKNIVVA
ncbi:DUF1189 family protein [Candidatus Poribacteria bacterium]|nr:DUF1189 family protein [Candidatus Poribacteria bacterium]